MKNSVSTLTLPEVVLIDGSMSPYAPALAFLCAYHLSRYQQDGESYYGTETEPGDDIPLGNRVALMAQTDFGIDFDDHDSDWGAYAAKSTSQELSAALLKATMDMLVESGVIAAEGKMFVVLFEYPPVDEFFKNPYPDVAQVEFWEESMMTADVGWEEEDAAKIAKLDCGQALMSMSVFYHNIVRIR